MAETTSREFAEWQAVLDEDDVRTTKDDYYAAQIALESFRARGGRAKLSDFVLKFGEREGLSAKEVEAWAGALLGGAKRRQRGSP
jgi:hypothetical protein